MFRYLDTMLWHLWLTLPVQGYTVQVLGISCTFADRILYVLTNEGNLPRKNFSPPTPEKTKTFHISLPFICLQDN